MVLGICANFWSWACIYASDVLCECMWWFCVVYDGCCVWWLLCMMVVVYDGCCVWWFLCRSVSVSVSVFLGDFSAVTDVSVNYLTEFYNSWDRRWCFIQSKRDLLLYLLETGLLIYRVFYLIIKQSIGSQRPAHESDVRSTCIIVESLDRHKWVSYHNLVKHP